MINRLLAVLAAAGIAPTPSELRDAMWLADHVTVPPQPPMPAAAPAAPIGATELQPSEPAAPTVGVAGTASTDESGTAALYAAAGGRRGGAPMRGMAARSPAVPALRRQLDIARALRPFTRRVPSLTSFLVDEGETVSRIAEEGIWSPVLRPAPARWLDLALVVDRSPSMVVWRRTVSELRALTERLGAFRRVRLFTLDGAADPATPISLQPESPASTIGASLLDPATLIEPTGRQAILVVTDAVGQAWRHGRVEPVLRLWGRTAPVAVATVLPQRMWAGTGLQIVAAQLRAPTPGLPSQAWSRRTRDGNAGIDYVPIPVLELSARWLAPWAQLVAGGPGWRNAALLRAKPSNTITGHSSPLNSAATADQLVRTFRAAASPTAFRLACYLSATWLNLPVMRLVQRVMLPESDTSHLAEVFLGGLLKPAASPDVELDQEAVQYDFQPGVRDELNDHLLRDDLLDVLSETSRFISDRFGQSLDFAALLADPEGAPLPALTGSGAVPLANVAVSVLSKLGGRYRALADRLSSAAEPPPPATHASQLGRDGRGTGDSDRAGLDRGASQRPATADNIPDPYRTYLDEINARLVTVVLPTPDLMVVPSVQAYITAIQQPEQAFSRLELQQAQFDLHPVFHIPIPATGSSAVVFKANVGGTDRALRFYTREFVSTGERYTALNAHFVQHQLVANVATSQWIDDAITVNDQSWPLVQMEWIEGSTLNSHVDYLVENGDIRSLGKLAALWRDLIRRMQAAGFAHGDLQHGDVMVDQQGRLRLVDFDRAWIEPFTGQPQPTERGHPNYQRRDGGSWGPWMDTFPGLVIYTALIALSKSAAPWHELNNGENLLFCGKDFHPPFQTGVWRQLADLRDPQVDLLTDRLKACCTPTWSASGPLEAMIASQVGLAAESNSEEAVRDDGGSRRHQATLADLPEKMRVHFLAKLTGRTSREILAALAEVGVEARSAQSSVTRMDAERVIELLSGIPIPQQPAEAAPNAVLPRIATTRYRMSLSRTRPGCIVVLLDRSDSMGTTIAGSQLTLAQAATHAINELLLELCAASTKELRGPMRHYFDVGVFGYGLRPRQGGEGVESALGHPFVGRGIVPLPELAQHPLRVHTEPAVATGDPNRRIPVWIDPAHGDRTPMCEAVAVAGKHIFDWATSHPESFPPIVINITDGLTTDSPYQGVDLAGWATRLSTISTNDGPALLLNIFLSPAKAAISWFSADPAGLPEPGPDLFTISSPLPQVMIDNARSANIGVAPGARGLVFNADIDSVRRFLKIVQPRCGSGVEVARAANEREPVPLSAAVQSLTSIELEFIRDYARRPMERRLWTREHGKSPRFFDNQMNAITRKVLEKDLWPRGDTRTELSRIEVYQWARDRGLHL